MARLLFITGHDAKSSPSFEQHIKRLFLDPNASKEKRTVLCFSHQKPLPHQVAEKAREKKPSLVFDQSCPEQYVSDTVKAVKKRLNGHSPTFFHVGAAPGSQTQTGVQVVSSYEALKAELN